MNLLEAINCSNLEEIERILGDKGRKRRDLRTVDNHGWTPLHHAVYSNNTDIVKLILKHCKRNIKAECYEGRTALFLTCMNSKNISAEIVELLLKADPTLVEYVNNELVSPLHEACNSRRLDLVQLLVEYGAPVNYTDLDGDTPLHISARLSDLDIINYLLYNTDCDPTILNHNNMNALKYAYLSENNYSLISKCIETLFSFTYDKATAESSQFINDHFECEFMNYIAMVNCQKTLSISKTIYCTTQYNSKATFINEMEVCFKSSEQAFLQFIFLMHDFYNFIILQNNSSYLSELTIFFFRYIIEFNDIDKPLKIIYELLSMDYKLTEVKIPNDVFTQKQIKLLQKYFLKLLPFVEFNYILHGNYKNDIMEIFIPCLTSQEFYEKRYYEREDYTCNSVPSLQNLTRSVIRQTVFINCPDNYSSWDRIKQLKKLKLPEILIKFLSYE